MSKPPAEPQPGRPWSELRDKLSPEAQAEVRARAKKILSVISGGEDTRVQTRIETLPTGESVMIYLPREPAQPHPAPDQHLQATVRRHPSAGPEGMSAKELRNRMIFAYAEGEENDLLPYAALLLELREALHSVMDNYEAEDDCPCERCAAVPKVRAVLAKADEVLGK